MYKGSLKAGAQVDVTFACAATNSGTTAVNCMFIAKGSDPVPAPRTEFLVPGVTRSATDTVPTSAGAMRITVDLPDGGGSGTLTVKQGAQTWTDTLSRDDSWFFDVQP